MNASRYMVFALFHGEAGPLATLSIGTLCATREEADTLLADRKANGDAFPRERVRHLSAEQYNRHALALGVPPLPL